MIWSTDTLPCNGIACNCDIRAIERDNKIKKILNEVGGYEPPFYRNNHNLRAPNILFEFTEDEKLEYVKSRTDINYFYYQSQKYKRKKLTLYKIQEDVLSKSEKNRYNIIINSRQSGMSYVLSIKALYKALMFTDKNILIISNKMDGSERMLSHIKDIYQTLPFFLKVGILQWNKKQIRFDNGSRIVVGNYKNVIAANWELVILNDYAFYDQNNMNIIYKSLLPSLVSRTNFELTICSIPNDDNHFKWLVEEDNFFENHYVHWSDIPGRDEDWKKNMIDIIGIGSFTERYENIFINTKEWYRFTNLESLFKK
jgi:hypothetical protein